MATHPEVYSDPRWFKLRSKMLKHWRIHRLPCGYCGCAFELGERMVVDHKIPVAEDYELAFELTNLHCVHHRCNTRKHYHNEAVKKEKIGLDGLPDSWR